MVEIARSAPSARTRWGPPGAVLLALLAFASPPAADPPPAAQRLSALLRSHSGSPVGEKLRVVNRFFNAIDHRPDRENWGQDDYWSTPAELLARGAGDCEDLAIGKYFALRRMGVPASLLRITYVRDLRRDRAHMILIYGPAGAPGLVLDSHDPRLLPVTRRRDLAGIYGFNESEVTLTTAAGRVHTFPHAGRWRLRRWADVLRRAAAPEPGARQPAGKGPAGP